MTTSPTQLSRSAAGLGAALAVAHLVAAATDEAVPAYALVITVVTCLLSAVAAAALLRDNSFAPRVAVLAMAGLSAGGVLLVATAGLPGQVASGVGATEASILALGLATALVLVLDGRTRPRVHAAPPPYAL